MRRKRIKQGGEGRGEEGSREVRGEVRREAGR